METVVIDTTTSTVESSSDINPIQFLNDFSGNMQNLIWLLLILITVLSCFIAIVFFRRKTYTVTNNTISDLKQNKKYIPKVFVELNEGKEVIRYFIFGKKWKKRIIKAFNLIYSNSYGDILKCAVKEKDRRFYLFCADGLPAILSAIQDKLNLHNLLSQGEYKFLADYSESQALFEMCSYQYREALNKLEKYTLSAMSKYLILTGSAGNGKTNQLCSISELIMKLKHAVVFITAREISKDPEQYILDCLHVPEFIKKYPKFYWKVENLILIFKQKYFYLVIDAINENENEEFAKELSYFINKMLVYTRFKVIVSCRNEYYQSRFRENLVNKVNTSAFELDIKEEFYSSGAIDRIFSVYKEYFNFKGYISPTVKEVLYDQLLLLRIFFETYENTDDDVLSICKHEVFKKYIEKVSLTTFSDTDRLLKKIARIMIDNNQYDGIPASIFENDPMEFDAVKKTIDDSILISKKLVKNEGTIAEIETEVIYFVFDEMRDYVLAREIITSNMDIHGNVDTKRIIESILELKEVGSSALEGVIHYTYVLFRTEKNIVNSGKSDELCAKILELVRIPNEREQHSYFGRHHRVEFQNLGLRIILTSGLSLTDVEKNYIRDCLINAPHEDGGIVFDVMLKGTILGSEYNLDTYLDILFGIQDKEQMREAFSSMKVRNFIDDYYMPGKLEDIHRDLLSKDKIAAEQVQRIAELFLICFKLYDPNEQLLLENYFEHLSNHQVVYEQMIERIRSIK